MNTSKRTLLFFDATRLLQLVALFFLGFSLSVNAKQKVVYGEDNRLDFYDVTNSVHAQIASSTAAMIPSDVIKSNSDGTVSIKSNSLEEQGVCSDEKFASQPTAAYCSGFLVGPDLLATAGHCITNQNDCNSFKWVFNYSYSDASHSFDLNKDHVYGCKSIVERRLDNSRGGDFALIRLERKVVGKKSLSVRRSGKIKNNTKLVVIGHPSGLPGKVADGASVRNNSSSTYFVANLDTFGGNSGSAVFDASTGVVEGILVRGEQDYTYDSANSCLRPKVCTNTGCAGEDVTRVTLINSL